MKQNTVRKKEDQIHINCNECYTTANISNDNTKRREEMGVSYTEKDVQILTETIFLETKDNGYDKELPNVIALANVFVNRVKKGIVKSISESCSDRRMVSYLKSVWNKTNKMSPELKETRYFKYCLNIVRNVLSGAWPDLTEGCDFFHPINIVPALVPVISPWNARRTFGNYKFYMLEA